MDMKLIHNGEELSCDIITMFKDEINNINYVVYTDGSKDENGYKNIYASRYKYLEENSIELLDIEDDKEWDMVDEVIRSIENYE